MTLAEIDARLAEIEEELEVCRAAAPGPWQQSRYVPMRNARKLHPDDADRIRLQEERIIRGAGRVGTPECNQLFRLEGIEATSVNVSFIAESRDGYPRALENERALLRALKAALDAYGRAPHWSAPAAFTYAFWGEFFAEKKSIETEVQP